MSQYHASMLVTVRNSGPASSQYPNVERNTTDPKGTISFSNFSTGTRFFKSAGDRGDAHHQHDTGSNVVVKPRLLRKAERRRAEQDGSAQADEGDSDGHAVAV